ncbi:MAG: hypothetical protein M1823_000501 [Watsoniomyces obsoletus]|nr:MAG: hypothetical protein M1823_000501 [Watsoniomyces obsoletus]
MSGIPPMLAPAQQHGHPTQAQVQAQLAHEQVEQRLRETLMAHSGGPATTASHHANNNTTDAILAATMMNVSGSVVDHHMEDNGNGGVTSPGGTPSSNNVNNPTTPKGGKRELSQTKRAAQNRAAQVSPFRATVTQFIHGLIDRFSLSRQRAFRSRKDMYIKSLEEDRKENLNLKEEIKGLHRENWGLRSYVIMLQARLIELHSDVPPAPPNLDLTRSGPDPSQQPGSASASITVAATGTGTGTETTSTAETAVTTTGTGTATETSTTGGELPTTEHHITMAPPAPMMASSTPLTTEIR